MAGSVCGLGAEHDDVAERVEAADQPLGGAVLVDTVEVIGTEVSEGDGALQHVEGGDQDLVRDGDDDAGVGRRHHRARSHVMMPISLRY